MRARFFVAHRAHGQVRLLAADAIDSLPADLFKELPGVAAQAAALRLPLDVAAALGDTEEERAAADDLASQSASFEAANAQLAAAAVKSPEELARAREALARAPAQSPSDAVAFANWEREADAALRAATTTSALRLAQVHQLTGREILCNSFYLLMCRARVSDPFARLLIDQMVEELKLAQAESAAGSRCDTTARSRRTAEGVPCAASAAGNPKSAKCPRLPRRHAAGRTPELLATTTSVSYLLEPDHLPSLVPRHAELMNAPHMGEERAIMAP
jgi:hypothetical protein